MEASTTCQSHSNTYDPNMLNENDIRDMQGYSQPNAKQVGGDHYQSDIQCWDFLIANNIGYLEGTAIKYLTRWQKKGGIADLQKAMHFIEKCIETETKRLAKQTSRLKD